MFGSHQSASRPDAALLRLETDYAVPEFVRAPIRAAGGSVERKKSFPRRRRLVGPQGELVIERGLVRRENSAAPDAAGATVTGTPEAEAPDTLPEHYGHASSRGYLALSGENNHSRLLRAADDLPASPAWNAIETQRARQVTELPAKRADLLPWLIEQHSGTTLLDLLAFCTGTLLDGIAGEEKPHAINRLAGALNLDMTRYWTPTRATYFDHVSKARIAEVVSAAVSPKAAADLDKMKKADAAAAAEFRLAKAAWLPEILTDLEGPSAPS